MMETPKITQHALKVSSLHSAEVGHYTEEEKELQIAISDKKTPSADIDTNGLMMIGGGGGVRGATRPD